MKVEYHGDYINLRPENREEYKMLLEMYETGAEVWGGGSYTSISSKKFRDSLRRTESTSQSTSGTNITKSKRKPLEKILLDMVSRVVTLEVRLNKLEKRIFGGS